MRNGQMCLVMRGSEELQRGERRGGAQLEEAGARRSEEDSPSSSDRDVPPLRAPPLVAASCFHLD